tara:strand:- start:4027 stop:4467 length:441 start_codon:yes stop_codon:yes gene_type:complete
MQTDRVNTTTGEVVSEDEYVEMMLRNYEEADAVYKQAREDRERAKMLLYQYMDAQGSNGIPSETYHVRRKETYDYTRHKALFAPLLDILNARDLARVYVEPSPADGQWHTQRIKALAETYPQIDEILERVREPRVTLEFNRREDGK